MNALCKTCQDVLLNDDRVVDALLNDLGFESEHSEDADDESPVREDSPVPSVSTSRHNFPLSVSGPSSGQIHQPMQEQ